MKLLKIPGASLLLVGVVLFVLRGPLYGIPAIGGMLRTMATILAGFGIIGGGYLLLRAVTGMGR